jgi:hypothetical protein
MLCCVFIKGLRLIMPVLLEFIVKKKSLAHLILNL